MYEVGTKVRRKYGKGIIGHESEITKRQVVRDHDNKSTEIVYEVADYESGNEAWLRRNYFFVDAEATEALNKDDDPHQEAVSDSLRELEKKIRSHFMFDSCMWPSLW